MAAVTSKMYGQFLRKALNKEVDWDSDTIKVMLCTALTIDQDGDVYLADVTKTEVASGNGYTTGGATLANKTITYAGGTNVIKLDADDAAWANSTITARYAVIYDDAPATNKPVLGYVDFGENKSSSTGTFTVAWNASGIATITVS